MPEPRGSISHASSLPLESAGLLGCVDRGVAFVVYRRTVADSAASDLSLLACLWQVGKVTFSAPSGPEGLLAYTDMLLVEFSGSVWSKIEVAGGLIAGGRE